MKNILLATTFLLAIPSLSLAQSSPNLGYGQVPTAAQWNSYFASKTDYPITNLSVTSLTVGSRPIFNGNTAYDTGNLGVASSIVLGLVKPDGTSITNNNGSISVTYGSSVNTAVQGNDTRITSLSQVGGSLGASATAIGYQIPCALIGSTAAALGCTPSADSCSRRR